MVATYTGCEPAEAETWFSYALDRPLDFQTRLTLTDGQTSLERLQQAVAEGTHVKRVEDSVVSDAVGAKYEKLKSRLRELAAQKDWRRAYRNLNMFLAESGDKLPFEDQVESLGDCLRFGIKGGESAGELVPWIRRAIDNCIEDKTQQGAEEALDFLEAYGDYFIANGNRQIVETQLERLQPLVEKFDLSDHKREVCDELGL